MKRWPRAAGCLAALAIGSHLTGCQADRTEQASRPRQLSVPLDRDVRTLDPGSPYAAEIVTFDVLRQLYEPLVEHDPTTLEIMPRVARSWSTTEDGLHWRFELHPDARFVDDACFSGGRGRRMRAADVKYSIERSIRLAVTEDLAPEVPPIAGLAAFRSGSAPGISGIAVIEPEAIAIDLVEPHPALLHFLARPSCFVVPREAIDAYGEGIARHPVGSGPFRLVAWDPVTGVLLARNDGYWRVDDDGHRLPYLDALRFVPRVGTKRAYRHFAQGQLDCLASYADDLSRDIAGSGDGTTASARRYVVPWLNTIFARFDLRSTNPLVADPRLRQALIHAVRRTDTSIHVPARGLLPPKLSQLFPDSLRNLDRRRSRLRTVSPAPGQHSDVNAARRALRDAGYPDGAGLPPLRLLWQIGDGGRGTRLVSQLNAIGVEVEVLVEDDPRAFSELVTQGGCDLFRDGWVADYPDPENFLALFCSETTSYPGTYESARYDSLFWALRRTPERSERRRITLELEQTLLKDQVAIFLYHEAQAQLVAPHVANWEQNCTSPLNVHHYERVAFHEAGREDR